MAEFKKINPKNIKDIDGICTLTDITTSEEVAEFYNSYVVPNNKQKYAAISKNGIVYKYDPSAKKHVKIGVQNANTTELDENCEAVVGLMTEWDKDGAKQIRGIVMSSPGIGFFGTRGM